MNQNIGIVSPEFPKSPSLKKKFAEDTVFWFREVEACYAFLLGKSLDRIIIDSDLTKLANVEKYHTLIAQAHPGIDLQTHQFKGHGQHDALVNVHIFPELGELFKDGELKTQFQPIVHLGDKPHIYGFECLSRLHYQQRPFAPDFLFSYAQEMLKLTNYDRICLMQALALAPKHSRTCIFVNVRPQTLISADFTGWLKAELKKNQVDPHQLVIELTEQYCIVSELRLAQTCNVLKKLGIRFAIDDFGLGISNLNMVDVIEPSFIKIPGRFIKDAHIDEKRRKLVHNVLSLCRDFTISAIVENVELKEEAEVLNALGAKFGQGFYFYKPMDRSLLETILA